MEVQRAKILLEKINALYRSIDVDGGKIAGIERDLMLSYIRQLYEVFLQADGAAVPVATGGQTLEEPAATETATSRLTSADRRPQPEPLRRTYKPPRIIEIPEVVQEAPQHTPPPPPTPRQVSPTPPSRQAEPQVQAPQPQPPQPPAPQPTTTANHSPAGNKSLEALFEQKRATELSEKLSESPIQDLTKAMAINDRLLFMNELFGRSMSVLDETLRQLNRFQSMAEAKSLLITIGERYNWIDDEKQDTAKAFIKLVRRRYL